MSLKFCLALLVGCCLLLQGCLYTGHHFNTGQLLEPGKTHWELGVGQQRIAESECSDLIAQERFQVLKAQKHSNGNLDQMPWQDRGWAYTVNGPNGHTVCQVDFYAGYDTIAQQSVTYSDQYPTTVKSFTLPSFSLGWRLGVRKKWGPFSGVDLGWKLEAPTGPATLEFDSRFGLPLPDSWPALRHNFSMGWGLGMWVDNSLFGEYAVGWGNGKLRPFGSTRLTYLASQPADISFDDDFNKMDSYRRWVGQIFVGCEWYLPKVFFLPSRLMPTVSVAWPGLPFYHETGHAQATGLDWRFALGMGANL